MKRFFRIMALVLSVLMTATIFASCVQENTENPTEESESMSNSESEKKTEKDTNKKKPSNNKTEGDDVVNDDGTTSFNLSYNYRKVKMLGRTSVGDEGIICDHSASGIEFTGVMSGDVYVDLATNTIKNGCTTTYFTVYIDGERQPERFSVEPTDTTLRVARFVEEGEHTIKVVKQTESNYTICLMKAVRFVGTLLTPPSDKDLYIEFIGDSLTCGMGNIGTNSNQSDAQTPKWEDATQSYGYMVAEALNADYSIIAQSGIGIAGGWSNYPMATYYSAHSYTRDKETAQDFSRVPDVVVINLGTNDHFINKDKSPDECKPEDVERMTKELITLVRQSYDVDVPIIWAQGMVGEFLLDRIYAAIDTLGGEDANIFTCSLPKNTGGAQWHPTVEGHEAAAEALIPVIKDVLGVRARVIDLATEYDMVKTHGRTALSSTGIYCDFTASGIEFTGEMVGDVYINMTTQMIKSNSPVTYFTVYIDGQRVADPNRLSTGSNTSLFAVSPGTNSLKVASFDTLGTHTIKILKQTESNYNICEMKAIQFTGLLSEPPADKELYIEFIGDSLTCGMGNIGINGCSDPQSAFWEDGTQSYGYMVAEQLNADYSIISQSGIGIAGGWSNYPMETYYTAQSYTRNKSVKQEFKRIPDVIVINLGTNDYFINKDKSPNECKPEDVERMTEELILLVRKCYGADVPIIWAQGMVGTFVLDRIQAAIDKVGGADAGIYTYYNLPKNTGGAQGHPTVEGHTAATAAILPEIKKVLGIN